MNERLYQSDSSSNRSSNSIQKDEEYEYGDDTYANHEPYYDDVGSRLSMDRLDADDERVFNADSHLARAIAKIRIDAVMALLISKVAGIDETGTRTGEMDEIHQFIRRHNSQTDRKLKKQRL